MPMNRYRWVILPVKTGRELREYALINYVIQSRLFEIFVTSFSYVTIERNDKYIISLTRRILVLSR